MELATMVSGLPNQIRTELTYWFFQGPPPYYAYLRLYEEEDGHYRSFRQSMPISNWQDNLPTSAPDGFDSRLQYMLYSPYQVQRFCDTVIGFHKVSCSVCSYCTSGKLTCPVVCTYRENSTLRGASNRAIRTLCHAGRYLVLSCVTLSAKAQRRQHL